MVAVDLLKNHHADLFQLIVDEFLTRVVDKYSENGEEFFVNPICFDRPQAYMRNTGQNCNTLEVYNRRRRMLYEQEVLHMEMVEHDGGRKLILVVEDETINGGLLAVKFSETSSRNTWRGTPDLAYGRAVTAINLKDPNKCVFDFSRNTSSSGSDVMDAGLYFDESFFPLRRILNYSSPKYEAKLANIRQKNAIFFNEILSDEFNKMLAIAKDCGNSYTFWIRIKDEQFKTFNPQDIGTVRHVRLNKIGTCEKNNKKYIRLGLSGTIDRYMSPIQDYNMDYFIGDHVTGTHGLTNVLLPGCGAYGKMFIHGRDITNKGSIVCVSPPVTRAQMAVRRFSNDVIGCLPNVLDTNLEGNFRKVLTSKETGQVLLNIARTMRKTPPLFVFRYIRNMEIFSESLNQVYHSIPGQVVAFVYGRGHSVRVSYPRLIGGSDVMTAAIGGDSLSGNAEIRSRILKEIDELTELSDTDHITFGDMPNITLDNVKDWVSTRLLLEEMQN